MDKSSKINWIYIISIKECQSYLNLNLLIEISMVSKLMREKLKPVLFKNLISRLDTIKLDFNVISIAYDNQYNFQEYDYKSLREKNNGSIEDSVNDFIIALNDIKKSAKSFYFYYNHKPGYYLYSLINLFDNLKILKIFSCNIPYRAFADIGKALPNLNWLELDYVDLIKSTTDTISEKDIIFPPNLSYLKIFSIYVVTSTLLSDPYEYLFNMKVYPISYECFTLPKILIPTLKHLEFRPQEQQNRGLEEFLDVNPNIETLLTRNYNLNINSSLNSLKSLDNGDLLIFNYIDQAFRLSNINSLKLLTTNFNYSENIRRLCQLCPNIINLKIIFSGTTPDFQPIIDSYLVPTLSNLNRLKTLALICVCIDVNDQILDFTKFSKIVKLKLELIWGSVLNIKFENCRSLKQIELISSADTFTDEFKRKFNQYDNWKFKFNEYTVKGYKI